MKKIFLLLSVFSLLFAFNFSFADTLPSFLQGLDLSTYTTKTDPPNSKGQSTVTTTYKDGTKYIIMPNDPYGLLKIWHLPNGAVYQTKPGTEDDYVQTQTPKTTTPSTPSTQNNPTGYQPLVPEVTALGQQIANKSFGGDPINILLNSIVYIVIGVAVVLAIFMIIKAGYEYMSSSDSSDKKGRAKSRLQGAVGGLLLAIGAILILQTINPNITRFSIDLPDLRKPKELMFTFEELAGLTYEEKEALAEELRSGATESEALAKIGWTAEKEMAVRKQLESMGVVVNNASNPLSRQTDVAGLQETTISGIQQLLKDAGVGVNETVTLTGGSETHVHSSAGTKNHHTGYKADFRGNFGGQTLTSGEKKLDTFLNSKLGSGVGMRTTTLSTGQTITILKESDHWDVKFH